MKKGAARRETPKITDKALFNGLRRTTRKTTPPTRKIRK
jgi:hypothetical protein